MDKLRIESGARSITVTYEPQGDVHHLAAGDHLIVEYDNSSGDAEIAHDEHGVTVYLEAARWRVWSSAGVDITP